MPLSVKYTIFQPISRWPSISSRDSPSAQLTTPQLSASNSKQNIKTIIRKSKTQTAQIYGLL